MTFDQIEKCFPEGSYPLPDGSIAVSAQWLHDFARAIAAELQKEAVPVAYMFEDGSAVILDDLKYCAEKSGMKVIPLYADRPPASEDGKDADHFSIIGWAEGYGDKIHPEEFVGSFPVYAKRKI